MRKIRINAKISLRLRCSISSRNTILIKSNQFSDVLMFYEVEFTVAHEMLIKVKNTANFGKLADDILKRGVNKINSFTWKPTTVRILINVGK